MEHIETCSRGFNYEWQLQLEKGILWLKLLSIGRYHEYVMREDKNHL